MSDDYRRLALRRADNASLDTEAIVYAILALNESVKDLVDEIRAAREDLREQGAKTRDVIKFSGRG